MIPPSLQVGSNPTIVTKENIMGILLAAAISWHMLIIQGDLPIAQNWQVLQVQEEDAPTPMDLERAIDLCYPDFKTLV